MDSILGSENALHAAELLCALHGPAAPGLALTCARDLRDSGRDDVAREWDRVSEQTLALLDRRRLAGEAAL